MNIAFSGLGAQRVFGARLIVGLTWFMAFVVIAARLATGGGVVGVLIGCLTIAAASTFALRTMGHASSGRSLTGVALMAQVSMLVASMGGNPWQIDMHMAYFAALAVLVIYCDWIVIAAAAATVAVHHLGLSFILPMAVFPGAASLGRVIVHAVILIIEAITLIGVTVSVSSMFKANDAARRTTEEAMAAAEIANKATQNARQSEELGRAQFAEAQAGLERQRATAVSALAAELSRLAAGDLTARIVADFDSDYAQIKTDFNLAADSLQAAMVAIAGVATGIRSGSGEISHAADNLSRRTESQAAHLGETASALDEITATVKSGAQGTRRAAIVVSAARTDAEQAGSVMRDAVDAMGQIAERSGQITQIISVIDEIAFQTNLLALNAGVEAARAGDSGRGFAVVAQEVRALAQRSADAAKEIKRLISTSTDEVRRGVSLVGDTGAALDGIVVKVAEIDKIITAIALSTEDQANGLNQVNRAVNEMDLVTQQNAAMVQQATAAASTLQVEAAELDERLSQFRVSGSKPSSYQSEPSRAGPPAARINPVGKMRERLTMAIGSAS